MLIEYNKKFDFQPTGKNVRALGVRYWIVKEPIDGLNLVAQTKDKLFV